MVEFLNCFKKHIHKIDPKSCGVFGLEYEQSPKPVINEDRIITTDNYFNVGLVINGRKPQKRTQEAIKRWFDLLNNIEKRNNYLPTCGGIYFFVANKDFEATLFDLFKHFIVCYVDETDKLAFSINNTPKINVFPNERFFSFNTLITIKKGELIYVGKTYNLKSRHDQHLSPEILGTKSLKLGIRFHLSENLDYFFLRLRNNADKTNLERLMRKWFGSRFGS